MNVDPTTQNAPSSSDGISLVAVLTAVLWLGCLLVGGLGISLPYQRPAPAPLTVPPVRAQIIKADLINPPAMTPQPAPSLPLALAPPPPMSALAAPAAAPPLLAIAQPSPTVAFAVPVEAPARIVEPRLTFASPAAQPGPGVAAAVAPAPAPAPTPAGGKGVPPVGNAIGSAPTVQLLTFGQGEGRQPAPKYPEAARRAGQEGTVAIHFTVDETGRVIAAEPTSASPWSALNREALRVVREQWQFQPGPLRRYEVAIRFELKK